MACNKTQLAFLEATPLHNGGTVGPWPTVEVPEQDPERIGSYLEKENDPELLMTGLAHKSH
jgi:hypothetical protein